jgi:hypothetical protein
MKQLNVQAIFATVSSTDERMPDSRSDLSGDALDDNILVLSSKTPP